MLEDISYNWGQNIGQDCAKSSLLEEETVRANSLGRSFWLTKQQRLVYAIHVFYSR